MEVSLLLNNVKNWFSLKLFDGVKIKLTIIKINK